jgi:spore coat polysaccharide biosynthesis predicted glycosyltransferase SpsG
MTVRLAYVCEGGRGLGWGHVGRGRALVEAAPKGSTLVIGRGYDEIAQWVGATGAAFPLERWHAPDDPLGPSAQDYDVVVVDDYYLDSAWLERSSLSRATLLVDDWMRRCATVTGLVNPNLGAHRDDYSEVTAREWLVGPAFALLRREVREARAAEPRQVAERILVTLGGSDPGGITAQVAADVTETLWYTGGGAVTVVLGGSYAGPQPWHEWPAGRTARLEVVRSPWDFAVRCGQAELVICGASTTTYELAYLRRAFIPVALVENQARITAEWAKLGVGRGITVWQPSWRRLLRDTVGALLAKGSSRSELGARVAKVVDGRGVERVLAACAALC